MENEMRSKEWKSNLPGKREGEKRIREKKKRERRRRTESQVTCLSNLFTVAVVCMLLESLPFSGVPATSSTSPGRTRTCNCFNCSLLLHHLLLLVYLWDTEASKCPYSHLLPCYLMSFHLLSQVPASHEWPSCDSTSSCYWYQSIKCITNL